MRSNSSSVQGMNNGYEKLCIYSSRDACKSMDRKKINMSRLFAFIGSTSLFFTTSRQVLNLPLLFRFPSFHSAAIKTTRD